MRLRLDTSTEMNAVRMVRIPPNRTPKDFP
jgi:hypothetical protein